MLFLTLHCYEEQERAGTERIAEVCQACAQCMQQECAITSSLIQTL